MYGVGQKKPAKPCTEWAMCLREDSRTIKIDPDFPYKYIYRANLSIITMPSSVLNSGSPVTRITWWSMVAEAAKASAKAMGKRAWRCAAPNTASGSAGRTSIGKACNAARADCAVGSQRMLSTMSAISPRFIKEISKRQPLLCASSKRPTTRPCPLSSCRCASRAKLSNT